jgi:hypothetical protein
VVQSKMIQILDGEYLSSIQDELYVWCLQNLVVNLL